VHNGTIRYGVLFTRSIGDADGHAHLGLSATPEVKTGRLDARDRFVVLASDGVWDYMSEEDVAGLVLEADGDAHLATLNVVQT
jgi:serine/threonine protein phosphatase PrpC